MSMQFTEDRRDKAGNIWRSQFDVPPQQPLMVRAADFPNEPFAKEMIAKNSEALMANPAARYIGEFYLCPLCKTFVEKLVDPGRWTVEGVIAGCLRCLPTLKEATGRKGRRQAKGPPIEIQIDPEYVGAELAQFPARIEKQLRLWPDRENFMLISGIAGSGKSHALHAIRKELARTGRRAELLSCIQDRRTWVRNRLKQDELEKRWMEAAFLIIDGITDGPATEGWAGFIEALLDARKAKLPTLVTFTKGAAARRLATAKLTGEAQSLAGEEIEANFGVSVKSRLKLYRWVHLAAVDWRGKQQNQAQKEVEAFEARIAETLAQRAAGKASEAPAQSEIPF